MWAGGELQRFAIAVVAAQEADVYMIDEPSSYLDVRQRLKAAQVIGQIPEYEAGRETRPDLVTCFMNPFPVFQLTAWPAVADGCAGEDVDMGFVAPLLLPSTSFGCAK